MKRDYSKLPVKLTLVNNTDNDVNIDLRDTFIQILVNIEKGNTVDINVSTSEDLAVAIARATELGIETSFEQVTPGPEPEEPTEVGSESALKDAIAEGKKDIKLTKNITVKDGELDITGVEHFDGNDKTLTFSQPGRNFIAMQATKGVIENINIKNTNDNTEWNSTNGIQCYDGTYTLKNVKATGCNVGIMVNAATVNLEGTIDVSGNTFGGINVSKGAETDHPLNNGILNINNATILNTTEAYSKPTIYTEGEGQQVNGAESMFTNSEVREGQVQYYLVESNSRDNIDVNLEQKLQAFKEKYYNKFSNKKITAADPEFDSSLVYTNLGNVKSAVDTITVNDETIDSTVVGVSIGNNAFLRAPLFKVEDNVLYVSTVLLVTFAVNEEIKVVAGDNTKYVKDSNIMPSTILPISNVYALNTKEGYTNTVQTSDNNTVITQTAGYGTSAVGITLQSNGEDILDSQVIYVYRSGSSIGISTPERMDGKDVTFAYYAKYMDSAYTEEETKEFNFVIYVPDSGIAQFKLTFNCIVESVEE